MLVIFIVGFACFIGGALLVGGFFWFKKQSLVFENHSLQKELEVQNQRLQELQAEKEKDQQRLEAVQKTAGLEFENLANRLFEEKIKSFNERSEHNLKSLIAPLDQQIKVFSERVDAAYQKEARERFALKTEIEKIVEANHRISEEAKNLTLALKGDVKAQGNWGELILDRVLESSGLREGQEFIKQGKDLGLRDSNNRLQQPDVVVKLPEQKYVIIDSKVSLLSYERFVSDEPNRDLHQADFVKSLQAHIKSLSGKSYQQTDQLKTLDFVLLFIPNEGAFSLAMQSEPQLFSKAWDASIVLVSPTTLLATLRTIASIWNQVRQNQNALQIAVEGGRLFDKFAGLVEDLEKVGQSIRRTDDQYQLAMNKLKSGRGNLIDRVEKLRQLGAKATKSLPDADDRSDLSLT